MSKFEQRNEQKNRTKEQVLKQQTKKLKFYNKKLEAENKVLIEENIDLRYERRIIKDFILKEIELQASCKNGEYYLPQNILQRICGLLKVINKF